MKATRHDQRERGEEDLLVFDAGRLLQLSVVSLRLNPQVHLQLTLRRL